MDNGILISLLSSKKSEAKFDAIVQNIANASTVGYKANRVSFDALMAKLLNTSPSASNDNQPSITGSPYAEIDNNIHSITDFSGGKTYYTGNPLDIAIKNEGFFKVNSPEGTKYTRNGNFTLDNAGHLITSEGFSVLGDAGEIVLRDGNVTIGNDGSIKSGKSTVGKIALVNFKDLSLLKRNGNTFHLPKGMENQEIAAKDASVNQGYLELSNVNIVQEMVKMLSVVRANESYQKIIATFNTINYKASNELGKF